MKKLGLIMLITAVLFMAAGCGMTMGQTDEDALASAVDQLNDDFDSYMETYDEGEEDSYDEYTDEEVPEGDAGADSDSSSEMIGIYGADFGTHQIEILGFTINEDRPNQINVLVAIKNTGTENVNIAITSAFELIDASENYIECFQGSGYSYAIVAPGRYQLLDFNAEAEGAISGAYTLNIIDSVNTDEYITVPIELNSGDTGIYREPSIGNENSTSGDFVSFGDVLSCSEYDAVVEGYSIVEEYENHADVEGSSYFLVDLSATSTISERKRINSASNYRLIDVDTGRALKQAALADDLYMPAMEGGASVSGQYMWVVPEGVSHVQIEVLLNNRGKDGIKIIDIELN